MLTVALLTRLHPLFITKKDELDLLKDYGFALPTETKEVKKDVLYKELVDDNFKASLKEYDKALAAVTSDAKTIQALGDARCQAQC